MRSEKAAALEARVEVAILHEDGSLKPVECVRLWKAHLRARRFNRDAKKAGLRSIAVVIARS